MAVQLGRIVRGEPYPMLLGEVGDAQGFGEAGGAGCIELHVTDAALDNQIAYRKAGQLALAMRQRDRRRRRQPSEIGRLQILMQRLVEPEDPVRLDRTGKFDAVRQVIGRVHVEHQQRLLAEVGAKLAPTIDDQGLGFPIETNIVTAHT